jgi:hypothetical protein
MLPTKPHRTRDEIIPHLPSASPEEPTTPEKTGFGEDTDSSGSETPAAVTNLRSAAVPYLRCCMQDTLEFRVVGYQSHIRMHAPHYR